MDYKAIYQEWLSNPLIDEDTKQELKDISGNEKEIEDRFYRSLEFGTGGLRGVIGAGTNRMNIYTVRLSTQGLANYILKAIEKDKTASEEEKKSHPTVSGLIGDGVLIGHDNRIMSEEFTDAAALCLNANGIKTYVFDSLHPTPEVSYGVRELSCIAGIMVTASHNPREYNGYKVYWEDGAQVTPPHDTGIIDEVKKVTSLEEVKTMDKEEAIKQGLYNVVGPEFEEKYMDKLREQSLHPEIIKEMCDDFRIVYTPLNGTGNVPVQRILKDLGFSHVFVVPEQEAPDGNFPTLPNPNPELPEAFTLALKLAKEKDADIVLATDPDADRLGVYCKGEDGEYISFTGNMSGMLIAEYVISERINTGKMPKNPALIETIVTTDMAKLIAKNYGLTLMEVLTGFKYIGEQIKEFERDNSYNYVFGLEESYGCLSGTYARDKDAVVAVMLLCEVACFYKKQGKTLWDGMIDLYEKYGYFKEGQKAITLKGKEGAEKIKEMMDGARKNPPKTLGEYKVLATRDYVKDERVDLITGAKEKTHLPSSNVLYYELENDGWCCIRPSGTEPKIKFYFGVKGESLEDSEKKLESLKDALLKLYS